MSQFIKTIFFSRSGYSFAQIPNKSLKEVLYQELLFQLQNLEDRWKQFSAEEWFQKSNALKKVSSKYHQQINNLIFRLGEILQFLTRYTGPRIIYYVCSEIDDIIRTEYFRSTSSEQEMIQQVVKEVLSTLNGFFQGKNSEDEVVISEEEASQLHQTMEELLQKFVGKHGQENPQSLKV